MTRLAAVFGFTMLAVSCSLPGSISRLVPVDTDQFARSFIDTLESRPAREAMPFLVPQLAANDAVTDSLAMLQHVLPKGLPDSIELASVTVRSEAGSIQRTLEYQVHAQDRWALVQLIIDENDDTVPRIRGLRVWPLPASLESTNALTLRNASAGSLIAGPLALGLLGFSLYAAIRVIRSPLKRRWLWAIVALLGFSRLGVAWKGGAVTPHDAAGRPVKRRTSGTRDHVYLWDGDQLLAEFDATGQQRVGEYVSIGGQPFAFVAGATSLQSVSYFIQDPLGSAFGLIRMDSTGQPAVREQYSYNEYGAWTTVVDSGLSNRLLWQGMFSDPSDSTHLYYVHARWYDPQQGRFMNEDPAGAAGGLNQYAFAGGDPINGSDPTGLCYDAQCYLTLFGDGVYGWDLASGCIGCDRGADPDNSLNIAYGGNTPDDQTDFNPHDVSSACDPGVAGAANCAAWNAAMAIVQNPTGGRFLGFGEAIFWSDNKKVFDCADGRINNSVFGLMDGVGAEFAYDVRSGNWEGKDKLWYHGTVTVKVPGEGQVKYYIVGRIQCSLKGRFHWFANEDPWADPSYNP